MLDQIGLSHIFDDGTICFCLLCIDSITENYPVDRDGAILEHFRSEDHEESARNLFKICVPDPKCESRNVRYLDIVNNSELDLLEQGIKTSYVSKNDNHFVCIICQEELSKVCGETKEIIRNLQYHLKSEQHIDNLKSTMWWTYHPNVDANYVSLNKIFMYCSFCKHFLVSKQNSLLEFAADHIETELKKASFDKASNTKLKGDNALKPEPEQTELEDAAKTELQEPNLGNPLKTEFVDKNSIEVSSTQCELESKPKSCGSEPITENTQTSTTTHSNVLWKGLVRSRHKNVADVKVASSEINSNQVSDELESDAMKNLDFEGLASCHIRDTFSLNILKEEVVPKCQEEVEVFNEDVPFPMQIQSQKHKDLSLFDDVELEIQGKDDCICNLCHKPIEIFNKDMMLSYNVHFENCHPNIGIPLVSTEKNIHKYTGDQNNLEEFSIIKKVFSLLPLGLRDQLNFIAIFGDTLKCILCNRELSSCNDSTSLVCHVLQNHFSEFCHKSQYKVYLEKDIDHVEDEEDCEDNNQSFKGVEFNRSEPNKQSSQDMFGQNNTSEEHNTNKSTQTVDGGKVRLRVEVLEILYKLINTYPLLKEHLSMIDEKEGSFYCDLCDELLKCTRSGVQLIKHVKGDIHSTNFSTKRINLPIKGKVRTRASVLNILTELSRCNQVINQNNKEIGAKNGHFFCKRCDEIIMCTLSGKKLLDHLNGLNHSLKMERWEEEKKELKSKARPIQQVYNILWQLASYKSEVNENIEILKEKDGHFYCEICYEVLMCTSSGSHLIGHLRNKKHIFNLLTNKKNNLL